MAEGGLRLDRTLGPLVVEWIEANLVHGPGDVQGNPVELDNEQVSFLLRAYEVDEHGRRVVRRAVYSRPKGRAKTELAAFVACAEALGPVRFNGWGRDGRPEGRPVKSPFVRLAATEEGQAGNTYEACRVMLADGPLAGTGLDIGLSRTFIPGGGKILPVTASAASKEGGKETFAVFDETGLYVKPELHGMYETIRRNLAKRKTAEAWSLETTMMYALGEESVAEHSHRYALAVAEGAVNDPGFLFDHREARDDFDFHDPDELRAALAEVYGEAAAWMDLERLLAEAYDMRENDFRRFFLNQAAASSGAWISPAVWAVCTTVHTVEHGARVVLGFDGSYNNDSTALVGCTVDDEQPHVFVVDCWEKPEGIAGRGWTVPREEVKARVAETIGLYEVLELACDPPGWHREIDEWADLYPDVVTTEYATNRRAFMAAACSRFYTAVETEGLTHDGDPRLARHLANAKIKETLDGAYVTKDGRNSPRKIDLVVAAVIALDRAAWHAVNSVSGGVIYS